jgi:hypothetical protein
MSPLFWRKPIMLSNTVRIVAHTFVSPSGETVTVENAGAQATSRSRAESYVKQGAASWLDKTFGAIYFCDPQILQLRNEEKRSGVHSWYVGDSGGSSLMKAYTGQTGGTRVLMTDGGQKSFMGVK